MRADRSDKANHTKMEKIRVRTVGHISVHDAISCETVVISTLNLSISLEDTLTMNASPIDRVVSSVILM